jgi:iron complex transport system substrate-binding protein
MAIFLCGALPLAAQPGTARLVAIGSASAEIVCAVGRCEELVAITRGVRVPPAATPRATLGASRGITAEPIVAMRPTIVLADSGMPVATIAQLRGAGIRVEVGGANTWADAMATTRRFSALLGRSRAGDSLVAANEAIRIAVARRIDGRAAPRVLFVYARGSGTLFVAGAETGPAELIRLAGGRNALSDITGYKPLTAEAVIAAAPDVLLFTTTGLESIGGARGVATLAGLGATPAARQQRVATLDDDLLLAFGPRVGSAVRALAAQLHPAMTPSVGASR